MPDPTQPIAGIVRPALFADVVNQMLAEAQAFGRKTIEHKQAAGRKLIQAREEFDRQNAESKSRNKPKWPVVLKRFGFSESTARRLMAAARSADAVKLTGQLLEPKNSEMDSIYDDGIDPDTDPDKKPCRDCRVRGGVFRSKCPSCRALNYKAPKPRGEAANGPPLDMDGALVPEPLTEIWQDAETIRTFNKFIVNAAKSLVGLIERPGCKALNCEHIKKRLRATATDAWNYRPGLVCDLCAGQGGDCKRCDGRGWLTVMQVLVERAEVAAEKKRQAAKEWKEKQRRSNEPIPE